MASGALNVNLRLADLDEVRDLMAWAGGVGEILRAIRTAEAEDLPEIRDAATKALDDIDRLLVLLTVQDEVPESPTAEGG